MITGGVFDSISEETREEDSGDLDATGLVQLATMNRRFFISKQGYLGLGPWSVGVGDQICILFGGKVPYAVRGNISSSVDTQEQCHTLLGDIYCPGLMHGEAMVDRVFVSKTFRLGFSHPTVQTSRAYKTKQITVTTTVRCDFKSPPEVSRNQTLL
jgi:hypothetical protein